MKKLLLLLLIIPLLSSTCRREGCTDSRAINYDSRAKIDNGNCQYQTGCTDSKALNYDFDADMDDGSCHYSEATFYAKHGYYNGIPINRIDVSIEGSDIGSITAIYPNGPGNCSAQGTILYQFQSGEKVDWNSTVYLADGSTIFGSGTVSPSSTQECIKVNVTN